MAVLAVPLRREGFDHYGRYGGKFIALKPLRREGSRNYGPYGGKFIRLRPLRREGTGSDLRLFYGRKWAVRL
jgi:hypothetical protein